MKAKRRTEITIETHETMIIRFQQSQIIVFCESCQMDSQHLSLVQAVSILSLSETEINLLVGEKHIHYLETETGEFLICGNSVLTNNKK